MNINTIKERKIVLIGLSLIIALLSQKSLLSAAPSSSVSQHGITWTFDQPYEVGQFVNGDYWVVGPVTINSISPAYDGSSNGWEVNPSVGLYHGFDGGCKNGRFDSGLVPSLPYTSTTGVVESIVKTISSTSSQSCVKTAGVLTVLSHSIVLMI